MSHASGSILFKDGTIKHYEYDGTADVVISHLYDTMQEVHDNWRKGTWIDCSCGDEEDVEVYTSYGYGSCFKGKACKKCCSVRSIEDKNDNFIYTWEGKDLDDMPEWLRKTIKKDDKQLEE